MAARTASHTARGLPASENSRSPAVALSLRRLHDLAAQARGLALQLEHLHRAVQRSAKNDSKGSVPSARSRVAA